MKKTMSEEECGKRSFGADLALVVSGMLLIASLGLVYFGVDHGKSAYAVTGVLGSIISVLGAVCIFHFR